MVQYAWSVASWPSFWQQPHPFQRSGQQQTWSYSALARRCCHQHLFYRKYRSNGLLAFYVWYFCKYFEKNHICTDELSRSHRQKWLTNLFNTPFTSAYVTGPFLWKMSETATNIFVISLRLFENATVVWEVKTIKSVKLCNRNELTCAPNAWLFILTTCDFTVFDVFLVWFAILMNIQTGKSHIDIVFDIIVLVSNIRFWPIWIIKICYKSKQTCINWKTVKK